MNDQDLQRLRAAMPNGRANGTTIRKLSEALGWDRDGRKVRAGIRALRRSNDRDPIVTKTEAGGVYRAATARDFEELRETRESLNRRALDLHVTVKEIDAVLQAHAQPLTLLGSDQ